MNKITTDMYRFTILATSDVHGQIVPTDYRTGEHRPAALASLASIIREQREAAPELLLIDNGDALQGTPLAHYVSRMREGEAQTHPIIAAMNELHYDAALLGNHEFNFGRELLDKAIGQSAFPWLSAGIVDQTTGEPAFGKPYLIKRLNGGSIKVALLGVTTHYIPNWENPEHISGLVFHDALESLLTWAARIREEEQPDLIIAAYHGGFERDLASGEPTERLTGENQAYAMCQAAKEAGIDVLITGHQHRLIASQAAGVTVVQPGTGGQALGKVEVVFALEQGKWTVKEKQSELLLPDERTVPDARILEVMEEAEAGTQIWIDQPLGYVTGDMSVGDPLTCRLADHPFLSFVHRVQLEASGAELSVAALLSEQPSGFGAKVTMRDVLANFMFPNTLTVLRLSGRDIREALERTADYFRLGDDGSPIVNPAYREPKPQHYNYDMWAGIVYELDITRPVGERVVKLERNGSPVVEGDSFDVVMNNYRASGGGDYEMFQGKPIVKEIMAESAELVADYFRRYETVTAECDNGWRVIY
ncbi:bifunctional metallophosphatase/5'-nucleotidase [Paenibacillus radicis (ex Gao et al. 2016)]|uniref:2',3'-cyclic-nucleotide 2'-phosphodiesterase n=1 Tax=Paenibacillus radicis (ex Gao et al. 2016) TaxID=1737354 RepID=A0A917LWJ3_9BACL|nr:bifunctional UDP-sugar hydrolase/5'-nucleotidase [Paenibacillus radicis (ex Gao et al. 2016)]GGG61610.1 2',3'-cyclic-nucleotide 2'-phosphodiesterase [Paenibacillus radicis (ex Gao et al. 2016)]